MRTLTVHRKGYHRKGYVAHRNGKTYRVRPTRVPPSTYKIKDRGAPGRGKKIIKIKKGKLAPYHTGMSERERHEILRKKIRRYGALSIYRALNAQVVLRKRERGKAKKVFEEDRNWVKRNFLGRSKH